jgi:hypothetical protein
MRHDAKHEDKIETPSWEWQMMNIRLGNVQVLVGAEIDPASFDGRTGIDRPDIRTTIEEYPRKRA